MELRLASDPEKLLSLWRAQETPAARAAFLSAAVERRRLDAIVVAGSEPAEAAALDPKTYRRLRDLIASHDHLPALDALRALGGAHRAAVGGSDKPAERDRPLGVEAVRAGAVSILRRLFAEGLDPASSQNSFGTNLCYMMATHGWIEGLQATGLSPETLVSVRDAKNRTLLHGAARYSQPEMMQHLLAMGADAHARDANHRTPLFLCLAGDTEGMGPGRGQRWVEAASVLFQHGCSVDERIGKTDRSQWLLNYLADRCPQVLPGLRSLQEEQALQATTTHAPGSSSPHRL